MSQICSEVLVYAKNNFFVRKISTISMEQIMIGDVMIVLQKITTGRSLFTTAAGCALLH